MNKLQNKIDFVALVSVTMANANGDPLNGNYPRIDDQGFGEMSDVCIKRKIRNRMQDLGQKIFVQSEDRVDDQYRCLKDRASKLKRKLTEREAFAKEACEEWLDVRTFGQLFAFGNRNGESESASVGVRGPVSIHQAVSISPIDVQSMQITKSVSGTSTEKRGSDTMGTKHFVRFGLYKIKGSINVQLAEKTGFSEEDSEILKECLRTLFVNDASAARPDGSMEVVKLYWWKHNCKDGQYSSAKVHNQISVALKEGITVPKSVEDYTVTLNALSGLALEEIDGL